MFRWAPLVALMLVVVGAYWRFVPLYFQGGDTWPHIWTTRLDVPGNLARVLTQPIMSGTVFPRDVALFFRPLSSLSYAVNFALAGMDPFWFHLTDVLLHAAATGCLFALMRVLGLRGWPAAVGAATFALHPAMASVVPDLPRRHDSLAAIGVLSALTIGAWLVRQPRRPRRLGLWIAVAALALGVGELAKEVAYLGVALAVPTFLLAALTPRSPAASSARTASSERPAPASDPIASGNADPASASAQDGDRTIAPGGSHSSERPLPASTPAQDSDRANFPGGTQSRERATSSADPSDRSGAGGLRASLTRGALLLAAFALVSLLMFAWRWAVLGGIGGYYERQPPLGNLDVALNDLLQNLLFPWYDLLGRTPRAWLTEVGLVALFTGLPMLVVGRRAGSVILYGWIWLLTCAVFQLLSKSLAAWHSYFTLMGFAFLVGGVLDGAFETLGRGKNVLAKAIALAGLGGLLVFELGIVQSSVLVRPFDEWRIAGELTRQYVQSLRPCLETAPPGLPIVVDNAPESIDASTPERILIHAGVLGPYSVGPAVGLLMPDVAPAEIRTRDFTRLHDLPASVSSRCAEDNGVWLIRTQYVP